MVAPLARSSRSLYNHRLVGGSNRSENCVNMRVVIFPYSHRVVGGSNCLENCVNLPIVVFPMQHVGPTCVYINTWYLLMFLSATTCFLWPCQRCFIDSPQARSKSTCSGPSSWQRELLLLLQMVEANTALGVGRRLRAHENGTCSATRENSAAEECCFWRAGNDDS